MSVKTVSRFYGDFRGIDLRGEDVSLLRSPDSLNMWRDYRQPGSIRTRPALALYMAFDAPVYGVFFYGQRVLVHSGDSLFLLENGEKTQLMTGIGQGVAFVFDNIWYFKDDTHYLCFDGELREVDPYIPTTSMGRSPMGGGTGHEDVNMLTPLRENSFLSDGASFDYYLDAVNIDQVVSVTVDGHPVPFEADCAQGKVTFLEEAPPAPQTEGQDNVVVRFRKTVPGYREAILGCTLAQIFDNRVFFSGNPRHPNILWHCALNDPTYVSDLDYYQEGTDPAAVRGLVAGNNALWVFREPSDANTTVFYHTPVLDEEYGKVYPAVHSSVATGCVGRAVNFGDDILFFSARGMEGISGDVTTEQVIAHRSSLVDRCMTRERSYRSMLLCEWEGYLLVFVGRRVYLADSRTVFESEGHREYEWFLWELEEEVTAVAVQEGVLFVGTGRGVFTLTDEEASVPSWWVTPRDRFRYPNRRKTTAKRSCVAQLRGDVTVTASTDGGDFTPVGEFQAVDDHCLPKVRRKKFKDIQLRFSSPTRFALESATLECTVGGYVK